MKKSPLNLFVALFALLLFASNCKKNDAIIPSSVENENAAKRGFSRFGYPTLAEYRFDADSNSQLMFQNNETLAQLTNPAREFEIGKVLRVKALTDSTIEVANFAPVDLQDAIITLKTQSYPIPIRLFKIKAIRAHAVQVIKYPFMNGVKLFFDSLNRFVDLSKYKLPLNAQKEFNFTGTNETLVRLKKLANLNWKIQVATYEGDQYATTTPKDARRLTGFIINLGYYYQTQEARVAFMNESIWDNDHVVLTSAQKEAIWNKTLHQLPTLKLGVSTHGALGMAGPGGTFAFYDGVMRTYLDSTKLNLDVPFHEMGHVLNFDHNSTMTYSRNSNGVADSFNGTGACHAALPVWNMLNKTQAFPVTKSNYYYKADL